MTYGGCLAKVQKALSGIDGVKEATVALHLPKAILYPEEYCPLVY